MSFKNYLNEQEEVLYEWNFASVDKKVRENKLGITSKRVFHFQTFKKQKRVYRDIPINAVKYLENQWNDKNLLKVIIGVIVIAIALMEGLR